MSKKLKVLMLTWEFPPIIAGGLGMACYGMVKSLLNLGVEVDIILPSKQTAFFPLRKPEDADSLPVVIFDRIEDSSQTVPDIPAASLNRFKPLFEENTIPPVTLQTINTLSVSEKLELLGLNDQPETYINLSYLKLFRSIVCGTETKETCLLSEDNLSVPFQGVNTFDNHSTKKNLLALIGQSLIGEEDIFKKVQEYTIRAAQVAARNSGYDVIHAHDWLAYPAGMFIRQSTGIPLVAHIHATEFDRAGGTGDERVHKIEYSGMSFADRVIAVSRYTAQMIINRYRIDTSKISIIHNAHTAEIKGDAATQPQRIFKGPTILFLGRITIQKGPDYFLDVAKMVLAKHPQARFIMAGTGDMARKLLHKSASYRLKNKFLFAGFLNRHEVERILSGTDIYALPSVSEPFGIAPLEAMAYGITAIISKQSGVSEVVENAYKIDFWDIQKMTDTICFLIENPGICREKGIAGMKEVERIRWDDAARLIKEVYCDLTVCEPQADLTHRTKDK